MTFQSNFPLLDWKGEPMLPGNTVYIPYTENVASTYSGKVVTHKHRHSLAWLALGILFGVTSQRLLVEHRQTAEDD